jgi:hypothetical protein
MLYRIHRIKEIPREHFRWAAHTGGTAIVKPKDYEAEGEIEAATPYAGWKALSERGEPLRPGDLLEEVSSDGASGNLHIAKYVGFEGASWLVTESKPETRTTSSPEASL